LNAPLVVRDGLIVGAGINEDMLEGLPDDMPRDEALETLLAAGMQPPSDRFDEIYLQLFTLDLEDEAAIGAWVTEFDVLDVQAQSWNERGDDPIGHPYPKLQHYPLFDPGDDQTDLAEDGVWWARVVERESDEIRAAGGFGPAQLQHDQTFKPVTVEEFRWAVWCLRDLARSYWCLSTAADPSTLTWDNPLISSSFSAEYKEQGVQSWWDEWEMRWFLSRTLRTGLEGFTPRLIDSEVVAMRGRQRTVALSEEFAASLDLFAVCCLELFNHVAEGAVYKTCGNEPCGRWFVRQQGRSTHDQRRSHGVRFCSYRCARAHTQREYNRRRRKSRA
jgi:hypothetical protein